MDHTFHVISENSSSNPRSARLSPIISRHFIVSHFTFRSVFSDDSHSLNTKHWPDKITIEIWGSLLSGLHAEIIVATCGYFSQSDSSNISKLNNQRNQEILKSDFFLLRGKNPRSDTFCMPPMCLTSLFMENIFIAVSLLNSSTSVGGRPYQKSTGWLMSKGGSDDE